MITLKEYPGKILPGDEYVFKWTVDVQWIDNIDQIKVLDATKDKCTYTSTLYSNRHLGKTVSYDVTYVLNAATTSNLRNDIYLEISHSANVFFIPLVSEKKVLTYRNKDGRLILENERDVLSCKP